MEPKSNSFKDFYVYYLNEHQNSVCKLLHFIGTFAVIILIVLALLYQSIHLAYFIPLAGYGFAWTGHFFFEKNKPASFKFPFKSLAADFVLFKDLLTGRIHFFKK